MRQNFRQLMIIVGALVTASAFARPANAQGAWVGFATVDLPSAREAAKEDARVAPHGFPNVASGLWVDSVVDDGPAAKARLRQGDVVVRIGTTMIGDVASMRGWASKAVPGQKYNVGFLRYNDSSHAWISSSVDLVPASPPAVAAVAPDDSAAEEDAGPATLIDHLESMDANLSTDAMMETVEYGMHSATQSLASYGDAQPKQKREATANRLRSSDEAIKEFPTWRKVIHSRPELEWLDKNQAAWASGLKSILYGGGLLDGILKGAPIRVYDAGDQKKCVILMGVGSTTEYNSQRTTERSRANEVFQKDVTHALPTFAKSLAGTDAAMAGIMINYSTRDFVNDSALSKEEGLIVICTIADARAYADNKITEDDFVEKSTVYLFVSPTTLKRIKIHLE